MAWLIARSFLVKRISGYQLAAVFVLITVILVFPILGKI